MMHHMLRAARGAPRARASFVWRRAFGKLVRPELVDALRLMDVHEANTIQAEALPVALRGDDLMVCAVTGSGKTLMFLLPFLQRLSEGGPPPPASDGPPVRPEALVLVPTPELATQVLTVAQRLAAALPEPPSIACITGAGDASPEGARLVVATPDELARRLHDGGVGADRVAMVAIDEADAMLYNAASEDPDEEEVQLEMGRDLPAAGRPTLRFCACQVNIKLAETTGEESSTIHAAERMHAAVASHAISFGGDQQHYTDGAPTVEADASAVLDA